MKMFRHILMRFFLTAGALFQMCHSDVRCRNDDGNQVDWFILYKLPNEKEAGLSYFYMDESTDGWKFSKKKINGRNGSLGNTLKPLFDYYVKKTEGFGYILYNDQPSPDGNAPSSFGHSKGVVMLDRRTGLWLSHSTPKFPAYRNKDFWPKNGNANAQMFLCVTFPYAQFKLIGLQLKYIHAYSYDYEIPKTFPQELRCVAQRECYPKKEPWFSVQTLTSEMGRNFTSFTKYGRFKDDLYSGLILKQVSQDIYVKSWGKLRGPLPSYCISSFPHHVYNVKEVKLQRKTFSDSLDHSKWCVTSDGSLTCIADMNREESQTKRGGGAICTDDAAVGTAFKELISQHEPCKQFHHINEREL